MNQSLWLLCKNNLKNESLKLNQLKHGHKHKKPKLTDNRGNKSDRNIRPNVLIRLPIFTFGFYYFVRQIQMNRQIRTTKCVDNIFS